MSGLKNPTKTRIKNLRGELTKFKEGLERKNISTFTKYYIWSPQLIITQKNYSDHINNHICKYLSEIVSGVFEEAPIQKWSIGILKLIKKLHYSEKLKENSGKRKITSGRQFIGKHDPIYLIHDKSSWVNVYKYRIPPMQH